MAKRIHDLATSLHGNVAADVWPDGADVRCKKCGAERHLDTAECGKALATGWPRCCGATMDEIP